MNNHKFDTLIKGNAPKNNEEKWYPSPIKDYQDVFLMDTETPENYTLLKNICYNMQYLEFLNKELDELELSAVLRPMTIKYFVITGMSVLEGLFTYIVKSNGYWKTVKEDKIGQTESNSAEINGQTYKIITQFIQPVKEHPVDEIPLRQLIDILDKHHKLLKIDYTVYPELQKIRNLRNCIHLTASINNAKTDYALFTDEIKANISDILYSILTSENICKPTEIFDFLKTTENPAES